MSLLAALAACAGTPEVGTDPADPALAAEALQATALRGAYHASFGWSLRDRDARFSGEGAARVAPPEHARLDLFGPRGEFFLAAALVGDALRLPPGAGGVPLPPPALLWGVLGVARPPADATLVSSGREGAAISLSYRRGEEVWTYRIVGAAVRSAVWTDGRDGRMSVAVEAVDAAGRPASVQYRDWTKFVELQIDVTEIEDVDGHSEDTWNPSL